MPKEPISVTLDEVNLLWLRGQTAAAKTRSLSETLDRIVTAARQGGPGGASVGRSVVGTVDINPDDPDLHHADDYVRALVDRSLRRPFMVRERPPGGRSRKPTGRRRG